MVLVSTLVFQPQAHPQVLLVIKQRLQAPQIAIITIIIIKAVTALLEIQVPLRQQQHCQTQTVAVSAMQKAATIVRIQRCKIYQQHPRYLHNNNNKLHHLQPQQQQQHHRHLTHQALQQPRPQLQHQHRQQQLHYLHYRNCQKIIHQSIHLLLRLL